VAENYRCCTPDARSAEFAVNPPLGYSIGVTWGEVIRRLKKAGFIQTRTGKGSHVQYVHPMTKKEVWIALHTKKDAGRLGYRILRDAGLED